MGQCLSCKKRPREEQNAVVSKQDKNIDDKRMFKLGVDVLNKDFCIQIGYSTRVGYNRKAVKTYGKGEPEAREASGPATLEGPPHEEPDVS